MLLKWLMIILIQGTWASPCLLTSEVAELEPESVVEPLFWSSQIKKGLQIQIIRLPESSDLYYQLIHCQDGVNRPRGAEITKFENIQCEPLSDLWFPLDSLEGPEELMSPMNLEFRKQLSFHLQIEADQLGMEPFLSSALFAVEHAFYAFLGYSMYAYATAYEPDSRLKGAKRSLSRAAGLTFIGFTLYSGISNVRQSMSDSSNALKLKMDDLISRMEANRVLRFDGQDEDEHMDVDAMDVLWSSMKAAEEDTRKLHCK